MSWPESLRCAFTGSSTIFFAATNPNVTYGGRLDPLEISQVSADHYVGYASAVFPHHPVIGHGGAGVKAGKLS